MFTEKIYILVCHGCGRFHEQRAQFLSAGSALAFESTSRKDVKWVVPTLGCEDCLHTHTDNPDDHPIRKAFLHGMTPEARDRANREFKQEWEAKLEAAKE